MIIDELNGLYAIDEVRFVPGGGGLPRVDIATDLCTGSMYVHGAHVSAFAPAGQKPVLWMSAASLFEDGKPIRGGVPIVFPWFGPKQGDPATPAHGLVRQRAWNVESVQRLDDGRIAVTLAIECPPFAATYRATFGRSLDLELRVTNTSGGRAEYEAALHTYFTVGDVRRVEVHGLGGAAYIDKMDGFQRKVQPPVGPLRITRETDSVYQGTTAEVRIVDPVMGRTIVVGKTGSRSTVVWNPWIEKSKKMADFGDEEWPGMICVETANVGENAVTLEAGATASMAAQISVAGAADDAPSQTR